jgi:acyl dehydratase
MLPENIKNLTGKVFGTTVFDIERETVRRFADAVGDMNPVYFDETYAVQAGYGGIIAPPGYISSQWYWGGNIGRQNNPDMEISGLSDIILALDVAGYRQAIDSAVEYEFYRPVKVGDTITATSMVKDIVERGKNDEKAVFLFTETTYTNQNNEKVAVSRVTTTHR